MRLGRANRPALRGGGTSAGGMPPRAVPDAATNRARDSRVISWRSAATLAGSDVNHVRALCRASRKNRLSRGP